MSGVPANDDLVISLKGLTDSQARQVSALALGLVNKMVDVDDLTDWHDLQAVDELLVSRGVYAAYDAEQTEAMR